MNNVSWLPSYWRTLRNWGHLASVESSVPLALFSYTHRREMTFQACYCNKEPAVFSLSCQRCRPGVKGVWTANYASHGSGTLTAGHWITICLSSIIVALRIWGPCNLSFNNVKMFISSLTHRVTMEIFPGQFPYFYDFVFDHIYW